MQLFIVIPFHKNLSDDSSGRSLPEHDSQDLKHLAKSSVGKNKRCNILWPISYVNPVRNSRTRNSHQKLNEKQNNDYDIK